MAINEYLTRKIPKYYKWMYLDGYTPEEILFARRQEMLNREEEEPVQEIRIVAEVKIK